MHRSFKHRSSPGGEEPFVSASVSAVSPGRACWRIGLKAFCLCSSAAVVLLAGAGVGHAEPVTGLAVVASAATDRIAEFVSEASRRFAIPPAWVWAVLRVESLGDVHALSAKGAMGLMQIMPGTWSELRSRYGLGGDAFDPHDNIIAGAAYLRELHDRFGERGFLAAYNAGPGRYEEYLSTGRSLPSETLSYVATVESLIGVRTDDRENVTAAAASLWTSAPIFVSRTATSYVRVQPSANPNKGAGAPGDGPQVPSALTPPSDGLFAQTSGRTMRP